MKTNYHPTPWKIAGRAGVDRLLDANGMVILEIEDGQPGLFAAMLNGIRTNAVSDRTLPCFALVKGESINAALQALRNLEETNFDWSAGF